MPQLTAASHIVSPLLEPRRAAMSFESAIFLLASGIWYFH